MANNRKGNYSAKESQRLHQRTLQQTNALSQNILLRVLNKDTAEIGSKMIYSPFHQKGGMAGRGRKVKIKAMPYLGLSQFAGYLNNQLIFN
ncbi:MAG: phage virion morphogenesis protein [Holophagales bacterium]|jgi:phage gpG-like protein|nr:phage virion morphogenesis protein [Holophagales bacterium]